MLAAIAEQAAQPELFPTINQRRLDSYNRGGRICGSNGTRRDNRDLAQVNGSTTRAHGRKRRGTRSIVDDCNRHAYGAVGYAEGLEG